MAFPNFLTIKRKSRVGAANLLKPWPKIVASGLIIFALIGFYWLTQNFLLRKTAWELQTEAHIGQLNNPLQLDWVLFHQNWLYFNTDAGQTVAADQATGRILWLRNTDADSPFPPFLLDDQTVGIVTLNSEVFAFDATTGKTKWVFDPPEYSQPDTILLVDSTAVYFGDRSGKLHAIHKTTGQQLWQTQFKTPPANQFQSDTNPIIHFGLISQSNNAIFINHNPEHALITIDKTTGQRTNSVAQKIFYYQAPHLTQDGRLWVNPPATTPNPQLYQVNGRTFFLCHEQHSLCTTNQAKTKIISVAAFSQKQQFFSKISAYFPKSTKPISRIDAPKNALINQPFSFDFDLDTTALNNVWEDVTAHIEFFQQNKKLTLSAYPIGQNHWRVTAKLPTSGQWQWQLKIITPVEKYTAHGALLIDSTPVPQSYAWPGLGLQDAFIDANSNDDYFDQVYIGTQPQPLPTVQTAQIVNLDTYFDTYADPKTGFTAFRWSVDNFNFKMWREISEKNFQLSLKGGRDGDKLIQKVANHRLALDLDVFGFKPPFKDKANLSIADKQKLKKYLQYMVGRYGAYTTQWEIGNEVSPNDAWVSAVIQILKTIDPYHLPISINWERSQKLGVDFVSLHHYDSPPPQLTQLDFLKHATQYSQKTIFTELGNKNSNWDPNSATRFRIRIWTAFMTQTPTFFWAQNASTFNNPEANANLYLGPVERNTVKIFRDITTSASPTWLPVPITPSNTQVTALALRNKDTLWIYVTNTNWGTPTKTSFTLPQISVQSRSWYDPSTGAETEKTSTTNATPIFNHDLVGLFKLLP